MICIIIRVPRKREKEEVEVMNDADALIFSTEKMFKELEGKADKSKLDEVKPMIEELKKLVETKDIAKIKAKTEAINEKVQAISTELYQQAAAAHQAGAAPGDNKSSDKPDEKVVDAEVVDEEKKEEKSDSSEEKKEETSSEKKK